MRSWNILPLLGLTLISGCSALDQLYKVREIPDDTTVSTDATQRLVVSRQRSKWSDTGKSARTLCAEPSPDVAFAVSEALKFGLKLAAEKKTAAGDEAEVSASTGFERAIATSVVQLGERLATIQLLRDKMYRACEAFANGAITPPSYTLVLSRLDKTMVSLLASEMAAGAFGRNLAGAGGTASVARGRIDSEELKKAQEDFDKAGKALQAELAKDPQNKKEIEAKTAAVNEGLAKLIRLETGVLLAVSSNVSSAGVAGRIEGLTRNTAPTLAVVNIHRNYIDDDGIEPLVDACIVGLSGDLSLEQAIAVRSAQRTIAEVEDGIQRAFVGRSVSRDALEEGRKKGEENAELRRRFVAADAEYRGLLNRKRHLNADAYASAGLLFQAFCVEHILDGQSDLVEARARTKKELREIEARVPSRARELELELCVTASKDANMPKRTEILTECAKVVGGKGDGKP